MIHCWPRTQNGKATTSDCACERAETHVRPVLFSVFGFDIQSYGVSKALAALVAALLLARAFEKLGSSLDRVDLR
jgi:prolipoprotein diacylglyceryltransferase